MTCRRISRTGSSLRSDSPLKWGDRRREMKDARSRPRPVSGSLLQYVNSGGHHPIDPGIRWQAFPLARAPIEASGARNLAFKLGPMLTQGDRGTHVGPLPCARNSSEHVSGRERGTMNSPSRGGSDLHCANKPRPEPTEHTVEGQKIFITTASPTTRRTSCTSCLRARGAPEGVGQRSPSEIPVKDAVRWASATT